MSTYPQHLLQAYLDRFSNRLDVYAQQFWDDRDCWYEPVWEPVTVDLIEAHFAGTVTIGFYNLSAANTSKWLCADSDNDNGELFTLSNRIQEHSWKVIHEGRRPGRDGHLWLPFDEPLPGTVLRRFAFTFLRAAGIPENHLEIFPKQDQIAELGSLVRGPLGIHHKAGAGNARGWFEGPPRDVLAQLEWLYEQEPNRSSSLLQSADELEQRELIRSKQTVRGGTKAPLRRGVRASDRTSKIDWIEYAQRNGFNWDGAFWRGPCPSCKAEGHDTEDNHMWVSETNAVGCWRGCSFESILKAARR